MYESSEIQSASDLVEIQSESGIVGSHTALYSIYPADESKIRRKPEGGKVMYKCPIMVPSGYD